MLQLISITDEKRHLQHFAKGEWTDFQVFQDSLFLESHTSFPPLANFFKWYIHITNRTFKKGN